MAEGNRPVPDPTILTTQQLQREIEALEKLIGTRLNGMNKVYEEMFRSVRESLAEMKTSMVKESETVNSKIDDIKSRLSAIEGRM